MDYQNFQGTLSEIIKEVYLEKKMQNNKFSVRAFALSMGVPPGRLSEIIAGKRNMTLNLAQKFAAANLLSPDDKKAFFKLVKSQSKLRSHDSNELQLLSPDDFAKICNWKFYTLICIIQFRPEGVNLNQLSEKMGITESEVFEMLLILERAKLVLKVDNQYFAPLITLTTTLDVLDQEMQRFNHEIIAHHANQIRSIASAYQNSESFILPMPKDKMPKAKKLIKQFITKFKKQLGTDKDTDIYGLSIQLSPMTKLPQA